MEGCQSVPAASANANGLAESLAFRFIPLARQKLPSARYNWTMFVILPSLKDHYGDP